MKKIEDAELKKEVDRLVALLVSVTGRKETDILKAVEDEKAIGTLQSEIETAFDDSETTSFKKGEAKVTAMLGKALKKSGFDKRIEKIDDTFVSELVDHFKGTDDEGEGEGGKGGSADETKKLKDEVKSLKKQLQDKDVELTEKLEAKDLEVEHSKVALRAEQLAKDNLAKLRAVIPSDAGKAGDKLKRYLREFSEYNFEEDGKGDFYLLDKESGDRIKENGKFVKVSDKAAEVVDIYYTTTTIDGKPGSPLPTDRGNGGQSEEEGSAGKFKKYKGTVPKTEDEYMAKLADFKMPQEEKDELMDYMDKHPIKEIQAVEE